MAAPIDLSSTTSTSAWLVLSDRSSSRGLSERPTTMLGVFSPAKSRAVLCVGVACASISLLAALISMRWFLLMRRSYRHHLILFLIISDTWKSLWYFIFPIVSFSKGGKIQSTSQFCQASGFLLSIGLEASDFAILMIALHTILHVFKTPQIKGEGGLYPYRKFIYPLWLGLPVLSAGLAFTNSHGAYVTSGTFCYLPKRPYWYRLALSWIPRYMIFMTIFLMYAAVWAYVNIKFRGFNDVGNSNSHYGSHSGSHNLSGHNQNRPIPNNFEFGPSGNTTRQDRRKESANSRIDPLESAPRPVWENVSFITSKPLQDAGVAEADFAPDAGSSSTDTHIASRHMSVLSQDQDTVSESRKQSEVPTLGTDVTCESVVTQQSAPANPESGATSQLKSTRSAIRRQLRLLFVYPLVYLLMWTFPFASHCLLYSDYYAAHPPFWLNIVTTASLSLQAGVDCAVFSWRERPWTRIETSRSSWDIFLSMFRKKQDRDQSSPSTLVESTRGKRDSNWWEEEGKKRKDSVWMGTDQINDIISRQEREEEKSPQE